MPKAAGGAAASPCLTGRTKGTCVPECSSYGVCHCGCGKATKVAVGTYRSHTFRGHHYMRTVGHQAQHYHHSFSFEDASRGGRMRGYKTQVPIEEVDYELRAIAAEFSSLDAVAHFMGISPGTAYSWYGSGRVRMVTQESAARIRRAFRRVDINADVRLSTEALRRFLERDGTGVSTLGDTFLQRIVRGSVTIAMADEMATALGVHPADIWDEWYDLPLQGVA